MPASTSSKLIHHGFRAALIGAALATSVNAASARDGRNAALIAGAALGVAGGVALGAALASPPPPPMRPRPVFVQAGPPVYAAPRPRPVCVIERRRTWIGPNAFEVRNVEICR